MIPTRSSFSLTQLKSKSRGASLVFLYSCDFLFSTSSGIPGALAPEETARSSLPDDGEGEEEEDEDSPNKELAVTVNSVLQSLWLFPTGYKRFELTFLDSEVSLAVVVVLVVVLVVDSFLLRKIMVVVLVVCYRYIRCLFERLFLFFVDCSLICFSSSQGFENCEDGKEMWRSG